MAEDTGIDRAKSLWVRFDTACAAASLIAAFARASAGANPVLHAGPLHATGGRA